MESLEVDIIGEPGKSRKSRCQSRKEKLSWKKEQELRTQLVDETLDNIRKYVKGEIPTPPGVQFTEKSGLLY